MTVDRPIKTEAEYDAALAEIDTLMDAAGNSQEAERLELLSILVEAYESEHYPIDPPDPVEAIKFRMDQAGLRRKDLEPYIGGRARVAEVLNRVRPLSLKMIRKLNSGLGIPLEALVQPYQLKRRTGKARAGHSRVRTRTGRATRAAPA